MDKRQQELIYAQCFPEDSEGYRQYFLQSVSRDNVFAVYDGEKAISCGYLVPKKATVNGKDCTVAYFSAIGTLPQYRGKGAASRLIADMLAAASERGYPFAMLNPFDARFYERFGFTAVTMPRDELLEGRDACAVRSLTASDALFMARCEAFAGAGSTAAITASEERARQKIDEYAIDGITGSYVRTAAAEGFCFIDRDCAEYFGFLPLEGGIGADEKDLRQKTGAAFFAAEYFCGKRLQIPLVLARTASVKHALQYLPLRLGLDSVCIQDDIMKHNTVWGKNSGGLRPETCGGAQTTLTAGELCKIILCGGSDDERGLQNFIIDKF